MKRTKRKIANRYYGIDILRFVLAVFVFIYHFMGAYKYGTDTNQFIPIFGFQLYHKTLAKAVDVFFVISGFTMVYSTVKSQNIGQFLIKRIARIYPLYLLITIMTIILFISFPQLESLPKPSTFSPDYIVNSLLLNPTKQTFPVMFAWTLSYEVLFYVIFAVSMAIDHKNRFAIATAILSFCMFMAFLFPALGKGYGFIPLLFNHHYYFVEFIGGMVIGLYADKIYQKVKYGTLISFLGMVILYRLIFTPLFNSNLRGLVFTIPAMIIVIGALSIKIPEKWQSFAQRLGDWSYPFYIVHMLTGFTFAIYLRKFLHFNTAPFLWLFVSFVLTMVCTIILHYTFEKPIYRFFAKIRFKK